MHNLGQTQAGISAADAPPFGDATASGDTVVRMEVVGHRFHFSGGRPSRVAASIRCLGFGVAARIASMHNVCMQGEQYNKAIDTDAQGRPPAAPAPFLGRRSFLRCIDVRGRDVAIGRSLARASPPRAIPAASRLRRRMSVARNWWCAGFRKAVKVCAWRSARRRCRLARCARAFRRAGALISTQYNRSVNTDALRRPRAVRAPGASRRLPLR
jgi:hypothetical protein